MPDENPGSDQNQNNENDILSLVGEGKQFATPEEFVKSFKAKQAHIETIEGENANLRKDSQSASTIKDVMAALKASQKDSESPNETPLDDEDLQKKLNTLLEEREGEQTRTSNRAQAKKLVSDKLNSSDDESISAFVKDKAQSLGMSEDQLWKLSDESPQGFATITGLGIAPRPNTGSPGSLPGQNTDANLDVATMEIDGHKTKKWFDAQRREMGNKKYINDGKIQAAQIAARTVLGDRYYS